MSDFFLTTGLPDFSTTSIGVICILCGFSVLLPKLRFALATVLSSFMIYSGMHEVLGILGAYSLLAWFLSGKGIKAGEVIFLQILTTSILIICLTKLGSAYGLEINVNFTMSAAVFAGFLTWVSHSFLLVTIAAAVIPVAVLTNSHHAFFATLIASGSLLLLCRFGKISHRGTIHE